MTVHNAPQPDLTLLLDMDGVIREATLSVAMSHESVNGWLGQPWSDVGGESSDKIKRMVQDTHQSGISAFRQIMQRFPSGLEVPMEFTTVLLGGRSGMLAIGKNLQAVAELQARLISAQQTIERDYWKLRDIETRYRLVIEDANEAVLLVKVSDLKIVEANRSALAAFSSTSRKRDTLAGRDLLQDISPKDRGAIEAMLRQVRDLGKAPGIVVHLGDDAAPDHAKSDHAKPWVMRGSLMTSDNAPMFLLQMMPASQKSIEPPSAEPSIDEFLESFPDGVVTIDASGIISHANSAFTDMVELGSRNSVKGQRLGRWLSRPGADLNVLVTNVQRHGIVRMLSTTIQGELGSETAVEISAAMQETADGADAPIVLCIRNVARRLATTTDADDLRVALTMMDHEVGKTPLRKLVKRTVEMVEQHYVRGALELAGGNRTSAAEILGLSRQSLYAKLDRYGIDEEK